jgi:hypothetical protein
MGPITQELYKQIKGWRIYSVVAPAVFTATTALLYLYFGTHFETLFYIGVTIFTITCIAWWHWSLSTMLTMIGIMKDTDDHFEEVARKLEELRLLNGGRPDLKIVTKPIDNSK